MNASALLDPLNFCKASAKLPPYTHGASRSINGTDAAQRLLRGKRDLLLAAKNLKNVPVLLDGHGVPPALFQHCIDMAGALLRQYGPDVVKCSFHNHGSKKTISKTPPHVRVRHRDATNSSLPLSSVISKRFCGKTSGKHEGDNAEIDWDHNLTLYLTVMERIAMSLGQALELSPLKTEEDQKLVMKKNLQSSCQTFDNNNLYNDDNVDFDLSSLFFSPPRPFWSVDILRGPYFDFEPITRVADSKNNHLESSEQPQIGTKKNHSVDESCLDGARTHIKMERTGDGDCNRIRPFPVIEFVQQQSSSSSGHVLIRLQGHPVANKEFGGIGSKHSQQHQQQPVTLVFDACIQNPTLMNN